MKLTKEEVKNILSKTDDGDKILDYISTLEEGHHCHRHEEEHEHHHEHHCDCGCEDEHDDEWKEIDSKTYKSKLTVKNWEELLKDKTLFSNDSLVVLKRMRHVAAPTSTAELADMFGYGAMFYSMEIEKISEKLAKKLNIETLEKDEYWNILLNGWRGTNDEEIYALRPELYEAIGNVDLSKIPLRMN